MYMNVIPREEFDKMVDEYKVFVMIRIYMKDFKGICKIIDNYSKDSIIWSPTYKVKKVIGNKLEIREYPLYYPYAFIFMRSYDIELNSNFNLHNKPCRIFGDSDINNKEPFGLSKEEILDVYSVVEQWLGDNNKAVIELFKIGDKVKIIAGSFNNCEGEVTQVKDNKVKINVVMLGKVVPVECDQVIVEQLL